MKINVLFLVIEASWLLLLILVIWCLTTPLS